MKTPYSSNPKGVVRAQDILRALEPTAEALLNRHLSMATEWFPHEFIPYRLGRDYEAEPWTPDQPRLSGVARVAFEVNLLTEDNLPSYHRLIHTFFGKGDGAWVNWANRWTAEEGRHAIVLRDYLTVTRNCDPVLLERARMAQVQAGYAHPTADPLRQLAYVAFQELATRISHANTGRFSRDSVANRISERVAADENLHMVFYRDALAAALELDSSAAVMAVAAEVRDFQMPGATIQNFARKAAQIATAGIYDLRIHHDDVVWSLLRFWRIFEIGSLDSAAERAREELANFLADLARRASEFTERRAGKRASHSVGTPGYEPIS
ncbi:MAG: acyl-ACP desaturase [Candidatus Dormibacter sp.]